MRTRPKNVLIVIGVVCVLPVFWLSLMSKNHDTNIYNYEQLLDRKFSELREKLQGAELLSRQRENDLHVLRSQFNHLLQMLSHAGNGTNRTSFDAWNAGIALNGIQNISEMHSQGALHLPSIFTYLPHLIGKPDSLKPSYQVSNGRYGVSLVFGIPTIKRENTSYLSTTVKSLLDGMTAEEKEDCLIIIFVAEPYNLPYVHDLGASIQKDFQQQIDDGLIEIISPSADFYPDLNNLPQTYGDTAERVKWRTKQNLDFSFLMLYARSRGLYYVQLEDDVISKPGYFSVMKTFAEQQTKGDWLLLEFSSLGFIGKMFKTSDLPIVVEFFLMFHKDKPIDWLLDYLLSVKTCNPEKDFKHCSRMKAIIRRRYKPSLFQHVGTQSSLKGKVQKLKDKDFGKQMLHRTHVNPPAELTASIKTYQKYSFQKAYIGQDIFWGVLPKKGDVININLKPPEDLEYILFRSGNPRHTTDIFYNTTVEVKLLDSSAERHSLLQQDGYKTTSDNYFVLGWFDAKGLAEFSLSEEFGQISNIRISVHAQSESWVIVSEIHLKPRQRKS